MAWPAQKASNLNSTLQKGQARTMVACVVGQAGGGHQGHHQQRHREQPHRPLLACLGRLCLAASGEWVRGRGKAPGSGVQGLHAGEEWHECAKLYLSTPHQQEGVLAPNLHLEIAQYDRSTTTVKVRYGSLTVLFKKKE